jgi:hypothetical protein
MIDNVIVYLEFNSKYIVLNLHIALLLLFLIEVKHAYVLTN